MVSRNYTIQSDKSSALNAKSPNNNQRQGNGVYANKAPHNNQIKTKQNIYYKQTSVGTQYSSPMNIPPLPTSQTQKENASPKPTRYTYTSALPKPFSMPTYTTTLKEDTSSKSIELKNYTTKEEVSSFTYLPSNVDSTLSNETKPRINCIDISYQQYSPNITSNSSTEGFTVKSYKIRPQLNQSNGNHANVNANNLPTIAESVVEDLEYPVDVEHTYGYSAKTSKCMANSMLKNGGVGCCQDPNGVQNGLRAGRFQYITDQPIEITDSLKGYHKTYKYQGTHPDSLYRVAALGGAEAGVWGRRTAHMMETCRPLRWPLALAAGCITLALLVFFLMPDSNPLLLSDNLNSTEWLQGEEQIFSRQSEESRRNPGDSKSQGNSLLEDLGLTPPKMSTESPPPDTTRYFNKDDLRFEYVDEGALEDDGLESFVEIYSGSGLEPVERSTSTTPAPPLFPTNISPSVQYGNEHQDADSNEKRTQKKKTAAGPATDIYDSKFLTQTFAIFYNKDVIDATTGKSLLSSDSEQDNTSEGILDVSVDVESKKGTVGKRMPSFTSGHQNSFGIPIEEASKLKTTTPAAIYNTKVSPTLPSMVGRNVVRSTTIRSRWNTTDDGICNSTRLSMCRGVLPYDLTTQPLVPGITSASDLDAAVPYFDRVVRSGCSPRARQFVCALLEPECTPRGMKVLPPCRRACKAVAESCQDVLAGVPQLSSVFQCSQYPESGAGGACAWRGGPSAGACLAGEVRCPADNSCIPARWRCDGVADCPQATDEEDCDAPGCSEAEFRCGDNGSCIPEEWVCDGHQDCPGAEDEVSCSGSGSSHDVLSAASQYTRPARLPRPRGPAPVYSVTSRASPEYESSKELLMMSDSVVPVIKPISSLTARRRPSPATTTPRILQVTSKSSSTSVSQSTNCQTPECLNKNKEKMEKEDEYEVTGSGNAGTSHSSPCPQGELRCVDGRCITLAQLCDHHVDCTDGADETNCFT